MTKVAIKNENITSFGGIYHIMDVFSKLGFEKLTESVFGKRGSSGKAFRHGSVFGSLFFSYLCGGECLGDINALIGQFKQRPDTLLASADTVGRGLKELTDCQARDKRKHEYAFNTSFTALNVAKIICKELGTSIGLLKAKMINAYYAQRIIDVFEKSPNTPLNKERINDILSFATDVALYLTNYCSKNPFFNWIIGK